MFDRDFFERLENEKLRSYFTEFNVETVSVWIITDTGEYCAWKLQDVEEGTLSFYYHDAEYTAHIPEKRQEPDREWAAPAAIVRYEDIREIHILPFGETLASRKSPNKEPSDLPIGFNAHIYKPPDEGAAARGG